MKKKLLPKILLWTLFSFFAYTIFSTYIISGGFKDYKKYCSEFIPELEYYHQKHHKYPKNLLDLAGGKTGFSFIYSLDDCHYSEVKEGYSFVISDGFIGMSGYESWKDEWWHD